MSDRSEKVYISVHEFIHSWEKEIYELNNLDYFTFKLINELGYNIENNYFNQQKKTPYLTIDPDDIGTLAFNLSDSLESFFENNCFGDCSLACPIKLNEPVSPEEREFANNHLQIIQMVYDINWNKRHYFISDILNYVVLDTLFDFYNYEIGLDLDDKDIGLIQFADFITDIIEKFIEKNGKLYLEKPHESASALFTLILQETGDKWEDISRFNFDDDEDEIESWKNNRQSIAQINETFSAVHEFPERSARVLGFFQRYLIDFLGVDHLEELISEDIEEFLCFWLVRETAMGKNIDFEEIWKTLEQYFKWLDIAQDLNLSEDYLFFKDLNAYNIELSVRASKKYIENNKPIDGFIESCTDDKNLIGGFFEITGVSPSGFIRVKDIHLMKEYINVQLAIPMNLDPICGFIIEGTIKPTTYGWRFINLDYIYPPTVKPYV